MVTNGDCTIPGAECFCREGAQKGTKNILGSERFGLVRIASEQFGFLNCGVPSADCGVSAAWVDKKALAGCHKKFHFPDSFG